MKRCFLSGILLALTFSLALVPVCSAESLWSERNTWSIFSDRKAHDVGDTLVIVINETSTTTAARSSANSKSGNVNIGLGIGWLDFLNRASSASGSDSFKAQGNATATNRASGNIAVTVVDVLENGNMVVEGTHSVWQNRNEHKITLRGIVRQDDVNRENQVLSSKVANAEVHFDGKGPLNAKQRQGILTQIFNILF